MDEPDSLADRAKEWLERFRDSPADVERRGTQIYVVVGLGSFGGVIATELMRFGNDVIGIDNDPKVVAQYADKLTQALILDARDDAALREAGVGDCDFGIVGMASNLEASVLSVVNLKFVGVEHIWAKADSRTHHRILNKLGVDRVVHPEEETGRTVAQILHNPLIRDYATLGNGFYVVNFIVPSSLEGKKIADLDLFARHAVRPIGVMRGSEYLGAADCQHALETDDKLVLLGTRKDLRTFSETL